MSNDRVDQLSELISDVVEWHRDRNLIFGSDDKAQVVKLAEEFGELAKAVAKQQDVRDHIGDMLVVMINIAERNGVSLHECLAVAYAEIASRKGRMVNGVFIKESDDA